MPNLATDLARVMAALSELPREQWDYVPAQPGYITTIHAGGEQIGFTTNEGRHGIGAQNDFAAVIVDAINFLRQHGPEIAETFKETSNG